VFYYSFSVDKRTFPNAIHSETRAVYGDKCFTRPAIHVWCKKFACGRESVADQKRSGQCVVLTTNAAIAAVTSLLWSDWHVSISVQINLGNMLKNKMLMFDLFKQVSLLNAFIFLVLVTRSGV